MPRGWRSILGRHRAVLAQFFLRKHPDGRVAGQQAAGLNAVTPELLKNLDLREPLDKVFLPAEAITFAGAPR
jgi:hypothetical protein